MEHVNLARELARKVGKLVTALGALDLGLTLLSIPLGYDYLSLNFIFLFIAGRMLSKGNIARMLQIRTICGVILSGIVSIFLLIPFYRPWRLMLLHQVGDIGLVTSVMIVVYAVVFGYIFRTFSTPQLGFLADPTGTPFRKSITKPTTALLFGALIPAIVLVGDMAVNTQALREKAVAASGQALDPDSIHIISYRSSTSSSRSATSVTFTIMNSVPPKEMTVSWSN